MHFAQLSLFLYILYYNMIKIVKNPTFPFITYINLLSQCLSLYVMIYIKERNGKVWVCRLPTIWIKEIIIKRKIENIFSLTTQCVQKIAFSIYFLNFKNLRSFSIIMECMYFCLLHFRHDIGFIF